MGSPRAHRDFSPGEHDAPDRLLIPEKLYGRAREIETLLTAFDRVVAGGRPELVLVSGYSGIGKSAVVNELHKPLVPPRGLFASGKFDQYKRDIPYATLAQAFQSLTRPLLSKSEEDLGKWRDALQEALDPNGQLMVALVPELKPSSESSHRCLNFRSRTRSGGSIWYSVDFSVYSRGRNIPWPSFSTICNGSTRRRWT